MFSRALSLSFLAGLVGGCAATSPGGVVRTYYIAAVEVDWDYAHVNGLTVKKGDRVRWYLFGLTGFEMHAPHWHGQTALVNHMRTDVTSLTPMEMVTAV